MLTYFRRDGRQYMSAEYESTQSSFAAVLAEVRANRLQQGRSPGLTGRANCYHILVVAEKHRAILHAAALRRK